MQKKRFSVFEYTRDLNGRWFPTKLFASGLLNIKDAQAIKRKLDGRYAFDINSKIRIKSKAATYKF